MIVDTSVLIGVERARAPIAGLFTHADVTAIATITVSELEVGIRLADSGTRRAEREQFLAEVLQDFAVLPLTIAVAQEHARIRVELRGQGLSIGYADAIIAATALANGHDVLTYNVGEFRRVPGLRVLTIDGAGSVVEA